MRDLWPFAVATLLALSAANAEFDSIAFIAPTNDSMPLARFKDDVLVEGIVKDLGDAIAARMNRQPRYVSLPSARVSDGLNLGLADVLCYAIPAWLTGEFYWSEPFIDDAEMIVAHADAPPIRSLAALADQPVGTVIAYHYREVQEALGSHFRRDDAKTMELNIKKIVTGRMRYAIVEKLPFDYALKRDPTKLVRVDLIYSPFKAQCALAKGSAIPFADFDAATRAIMTDGTMARIAAAYR